MHYKKLTVAMILLLTAVLGIGAMADGEMSYEIVAKTTEREMDVIKLIDTYDGVELEIVEKTTEREMDVIKLIGTDDGVELEIEVAEVLALEDGLNIKLTLTNRGMFSVFYIDSRVRESGELAELAEIIESAESGESARLPAFRFTLLDKDGNFPTASERGRIFRREMILSSMRGYNLMIEVAPEQSREWVVPFHEFYKLSPGYYTLSIGMPIDIHTKPNPPKHEIVTGNLHIGDVPLQIRR